MDETATSEVKAALVRFNEAFASGDPDALAQQFSVDARLLLLYSEPIEGREAIRAQWAGLFAAYDTSAWLAHAELVDVHGDRAYALSVYSETLVPREAGASRVVRGRLIQFLRRDPDGCWRTTLLLNSHIRPVEKVAMPEAGR